MDKADQFGVIGNASYENIHNMDVKKAEDMVQLSSSPPMLDNGGFDLSPITPDSNKESLDLMSSPLSIICSPMNQADDDDCLSTPKKGVFDPFAPGPENLMMAPRSMKYLEESRNFVARRLNFNCGMKKDVCESDFEDDILFEVIYESLLKVIICKHAEDMVGEISSVDPYTDAEKTPPFTPGIAETCPGAPLKSVKKSRNIDLSMCRKLDFGF